MNLTEVIADVSRLYARRGEITHELEQVMQAIDRGRAVIAALQQLAQSPASATVQGGGSSGTPTRSSDAPDSISGAPTSTQNAAPSSPSAAPPANLAAVAPTD